MPRSFAFSDENRITQNISAQTGVSSVSEIEQLSDGSLVVAGSITNYGGVSGRNNLIKVTQDGVISETFTQNSSDGSKFSNQNIYAIEKQADESLLVGGSFNYTGGAYRSGLIKLNADGSLDPTYTDNATGQNKQLGQINSISPQSDGSALIGGNFTGYEGRWGRFLKMDSNGLMNDDFNFVSNYPFLNTSSVANVAATANSDLATLPAGSNFNNLSIGAEISHSAFNSGTFIIDIYTNTSGLKTIKLSSKAKQTATATLTKTGIYKCITKVASNTNDPDFIFDSYRCANVKVKTVSGSEEILILADFEYFNFNLKTKIFCPGFPNGATINGNAGTKYNVIVDNVKYIRIEATSLATSTTSGLYEDGLIFREVTIKFSALNASYVQVTGVFFQPSGITVGDTLYELGAPTLFTNGFARVLDTFTSGISFNQVQNIILDRNVIGGTVGTNYVVNVTIDKLQNYRTKESLFSNAKIDIGAISTSTPESVISFNTFPGNTPKHFLSTGDYVNISNVYNSGGTSLNGLKQVNVDFNIVSGTAGNPTTITCSTITGFDSSSQNPIIISGTGVPGLDGSHNATFVSGTTFTVPVSVATPFTGGSFKNLKAFKIPTPSLPTGVTSSSPFIEIKGAGFSSDFNAITPSGLIKNALDYRIYKTITNIQTTHISGVGDSSPTVNGFLITTSDAHRFSAGTIIYISSTNTSPNINGYMIVKTIPSATQFTLQFHPFNTFTISSTTGTCTAPLDMVFDFGSKFLGDVTKIITQPDGKILICGSFTNYVNSGRSFLVRLNSDGTLDDSFMNNLPYFLGTVIYGMDVFSNGDIILGGTFTVRDTSHSNLVKLSSSGVLDTSFYPSGFPASNINNISCQESGKVLISGGFTNFNGVSGRNGIIRLNVDGSLDTTFCTKLIDGKDATMNVQDFGNNGIYFYGNSLTYKPITKIVEPNLDNDFNII